MPVAFATGCTRRAFPVDRISFFTSQAVVLVHGCFWHRHVRCRYTTVPSTRPEFWQAKFEANLARDRAVRGALLEAGWRVATVLECAVRKPQQVEEAVNLVAAWLRCGSTEIDIGDTEVIDERCGASRCSGFRFTSQQTQTRLSSD